MSAAPEPASFEPFLPDVYRFATLMTGAAAVAAAALRRTVERAAREGVGDLRDSRRIKRWLFIEARHQCAPSDTPAPAPPEAGLAARFAVLPPAERGALILFYLYLFDPTELSEVLEIPPAELPPLLTRARALLAPAA